MVVTQLGSGQIQGKKKSQTELHTESRPGGERASEILLTDSVLWIRQREVERRAPQPDVGGGHLKPFQVFHGSLSHGNIEYPKVEGTSKDHQVIFLAAHRSTQKKTPREEIPALQVPYHAPLGKLLSSGSFESQARFISPLSEVKRLNL